MIACFIWQMMSRIPPADFLRLARCVEETLRLIRTDSAIAPAVYHQQWAPLESADRANRIGNHARYATERSVLRQISTRGEHDGSDRGLVRCDDNGQERAHRVADDRNTTAVDLHACLEIMDA